MRELAAEFGIDRRTVSTYLRRLASLFVVVALIRSRRSKPPGCIRRAGRQDGWPGGSV
jgi:predicted DNA-binding transcriptional regulator YafY